MSSLKHFGAAVAGLVPTAAVASTIIVGGNNFSPAALDVIAEGLNRAVEIGKADPTAITVAGLRADPSRKPTANFTVVAEGGFDRKIVQPGELKYKPKGYFIEDAPPKV